ncbi:MAG: M1 family metallopeptidase [Candidatus Eremiobacteraeota bacterium]|nr:M1 family metallopeptidase [Candidatus Eremiobacteraeota bacterium]
MRIASIGALALACAVAVPAGTAWASAPSSAFTAAETAQGFLPKNIVPSFYRIDIAPNATTGKIVGHETITITAVKPASSIVLNALQTTFGKVTLDGVPAKVAVDEKAETATFSFAKPFAAGTHKLDIAYVATIQKTAQGLFKQDYADANGKPAFMYATQQEATDGRRMFPSFDEPAFKAVFQLSAVVPKNWTAVSNTPVISTVNVGSDSKRVTFAPTPVMSTYLVVFTAGDFEQSHVTADGINLGVYATRGKNAQMQYALSVMKDLMPYYDSYYGVKFPISKLDTIAIPGGFLGAMENWGGITYNEQTVLWDPKTSPDSDKKGTFGIIAHEESHQWNGDLTTMPWWDELWLAEGFATWMQTKAPDHFHPEWQMYLGADQETNFALGTDALTTTHAAYQPVHNDTQIAAVFDDISYTKAGAVLRMLEAYVGKDKFQQALQTYFKTHQYTSASAADLWKDLSAVSGQDIASIAHNWIYQPGFPLVTATATCTDGKRSVALSQQRYLFDTTASAGDTVWQIPMNVETDARTNSGTPILMKDKTMTIDGGSCDAPLVINGNDVGFYRVAYDPTTQAGQRANFVGISLGDRLGLLNDSWAFASSGRAKIDEYLGYVEADAKDTDPHIIGAILNNFQSMLDYEKDKAGEAPLKAYLATRLRPIVTQFGGWDAKGMTDDQLRTRNTALRMLAYCGDQPTIDQAKTYFANYVKDPSSFAPLQRDVVLDIAGYAADQQIYGQLLQMGMKETDPTQQQRYFFALFGAKDPALAQQSLQMSLHLPPQFAPFAPFIIATVGTQHPDMAWKFLTDNTKQLFSSVSAFERVGFITGVAGFFWQGVPGDQIEAYLKANVPAGGEKEIAKAMVGVRSNQQLAARLTPQIDAYVSSQPSPAQPKEAKTK